MPLPPTNLDSIRCLAVSDTGFVFDPRTGHAYTVNGTGLMVLRGMKDGRPVQEIAEQLRATYPAAKTSDEDVLDFVARLSEYGLASHGKNAVKR
jgi:hypothetical protein